MPRGRLNAVRVVDTIDWLRNNEEIIKTKHTIAAVMNTFNRDYEGEPWDHVSSFAPYFHKCYPHGCGSLMSDKANVNGQEIGLTDQLIAELRSFRLQVLECKVAIEKAVSIFQS